MNFDDYAHHPTEIYSTLDGKQSLQSKKNNIRF